MKTSEELFANEDVQDTTNNLSLTYRLFSKAKMLKGLIVVLTTFDEVPLFVSQLMSLTYGCAIVWNFV